MVVTGPLGPVSCLDCGGRGCAHCKADAAGRAQLAVTGILASSGATLDTLHALAEQLADHRRGQVIALPEDARVTRLHVVPDVEDRPGAKGVTPEALAVMHRQNEHDIAAHPDHADALGALRRQVFQVNGIPPAHLYVGTDRDGTARPLAVDHQHRRWHLDDDGAAVNDTDDTRLSPGELRAVVDVEIRAQRADAARQREREIRRNLSAAHARATGRPLPGDEDEGPNVEDMTDDEFAVWFDAIDERLDEDDEPEPDERDRARAAVTKYRAQVEVWQREYEARCVDLRAATVRRAYAARTVAAAAPIGAALFLVGALVGITGLVPLGAVLLTLTAVAAISGVRAHREVTGAPVRIDSAAADFSRAHDAMVLAEAEYVLAGGDPWGDETLPAAPFGPTADDIRAAADDAVVDDLIGY